ncbi:hypothetical protein [Komagataeibacter europaeus]|uniref:hypothetical protein n=1 Tax=Komagataeibacter europaeus TaxID=33995 RepID=UPI00192E4246|nr:hypothetical protein [Komagataeibacter europaeus]
MLSVPSSFGLVLCPTHAGTVGTIGFCLPLALIRAMFRVPIPAITRQVVDASVLVDPHHRVAGTGWGRVGGWDCADQDGGEDQVAHGAGISAQVKRKVNRKGRPTRSGPVSYAINSRSLTFSDLNGTTRRLCNQFCRACST